MVGIECQSAQVDREEVFGKVRRRDSRLQRIGRIAQIDAALRDGFTAGRNDAAAGQQGRAGKVGRIVGQVFECRQRAGRKGDLLAVDGAVRIQRIGLDVIERAVFQLVEHAGELLFHRNGNLREVELVALAQDKTALESPAVQYALNRHFGVVRLRKILDPGDRQRHDLQSAVLVLLARTRKDCGKKQ